jgi:hypothetical protein
MLYGLYSRYHEIRELLAHSKTHVQDRYFGINVPSGGSENNRVKWIHIIVYVYGDDNVIF